MEVLPGGVPLATAFLAWVIIGLVHFGVHPAPRTRLQHDAAVVAGLMACVSPVSAVLVFMFVTYSVTNVRVQ